MRTFTIGTAALIVGVLFSVSALAQETVIRAKAMLDVTSGQLISDPVLTILDGLIVEVGQVDSLSVPEGDDVTFIDLGDRIILPGLMDMHVHLSGSPKDSFYPATGYSSARLAVIAAGNARRTLMAGFTTVRDTGSKGFAAIAVRDGINAGNIWGPRIYAAGHPITVTGGHCDNNALPPEMRFRERGVADGPWAVRAKIREAFKYGSDFIKICVTAGVFSKGTDVGRQHYTLEELQAAVHETHMRGRKIAAHAHGAEGIKSAIVAGVDSVEHASFLDDEAVNLAKEFGAFLVMDIYNADYTLERGRQRGIPAESIGKEKRVSGRQRESFTRATRAGAKIVFGTDAAIFPHGDNAKQFAVMVRFGMTPIEAIRSATLYAAELLGEEDDLGTIEVGKLADIIAVESNPLIDISTLETVTFVMKNGHVYKNRIPQDLLDK